MTLSLSLNSSAWLLLGVLAVVNTLAFVLMWTDKYRSGQAGVSRMPEGVLFFMAVVGGALGVYISMLVFRHKTRKWYFLLGIPLLIAQQVVIVYSLLVD